MDGVSEGIAMWLLPLLMEKSPTVLITIGLTLNNDDDAPPLLYREIRGLERIYTYITAVKYLLSTYATDDTIAEAALETGLF